MIGRYNGETEQLTFGHSLVGRGFHKLEMYEDDWKDLIALFDQNPVCLRDYINDQIRTRYLPQDKDTAGGYLAGYPSWRISYQSSEQAAKAAYTSSGEWYVKYQMEREETERLRAELQKLKGEKR